MSEAKEIAKEIVDCKTILENMQYTNSGRLSYDDRVAFEVKQMEVRRRLRLAETKRDAFIYSAVHEDEEQ